ncbi:MAG: SCO1664 family protein [Ilumatobacteraceae bacterium]|nr:SCO1664 family protein [Ilumatobacteraceae bacterium]
MQCSHEAITDALTHGDIDIVGRMPDSSNATFLVTIAHGDINAQAIYKPLRGERRLRDFEPGLHRREVAAFLLSEALGLGLVPITILRDGPLGEGSLQFFVESDTREHYFSLFEQRPDLHDRLREFAVFDFVANNTDRKSGHCLLGLDGNVWGIDHGVCFSADFKLRTVIWEFGGEPIPHHLITAITPLATTVPLQIAALLGDDEVLALQERVQWLIDHQTFPIDDSGRRYPWPIV